MKFFQQGMDVGLLSSFQIVLALTTSKEKLKDSIQENS